MKKTRNGKPVRLQPEEIAYIQQNCLSTTDDKMAEYLGRDVRVIIKHRKKMGIYKSQGGRLAGVKINKTARAADQINLNIGQKLTELQRKEYYKTQFQNSLYYKNLKEQFDEEEIDFYLEEWGALCLQFEDIVATEKRQIDELIKIEIMGNRVLRNIKVTEHEIDLMQIEVKAFRKANPNIETDEEAQDRDTVLMNMIRTMSAQSQAMTRDYEKNVDMKNKLLNELNARRKDRVDQTIKRGQTFLGLVNAFRERTIRENQGRHAELLRLAKEKKKSEWRKPTVFPDGSKDCVLLDEHSILPETANQVYQREKESIIDFYRKSHKLKILVVDDDMSRSQFFGEIFKNNSIEYASNADKALDKLKNNTYDLVCMDYDLGLLTKGTQVAEYLTKNANLSTTDVLVQSMNKVGAMAIEAQLIKARNIEVMPFDLIVKNFKKLGDTNA